jgi:hypothetical protein
MNNENTIEILRSTHRLEVIKAIKCLKYGKLLRLDNISAKDLKADLMVTAYIYQYYRWSGRRISMIKVLLWNCIVRRFYQLMRQQHSKQEIVLYRMLSAIDEELSHSFCVEQISLPWIFLEPYLEYMSGKELKSIFINAVYYRIILNSTEGSWGG